MCGSLFHARAKKAACPHWPDVYFPHSYIYPKTGARAQVGPRPSALIFPPAIPSLCSQCSTFYISCDGLVFRIAKTKGMNNNDGSRKWFFKSYAHRFLFFPISSFSLCAWPPFLILLPGISWSLCPRRHCEAPAWLGRAMPGDWFQRWDHSSRGACPRLVCFRGHSGRMVGRALRGEGDRARI